MHQNIILTLAELMAFDPEGKQPIGTTNGEFCCPLSACYGKPINKAHRRFIVFPEGNYYCHRCEAAGLLGEYRSTPQVQTTREKQNLARDRIIRRNTLPATAIEPTVGDDLQQRLDTLQEVENTPAVAYLASRGITLDRGTKHIVKYSPSWYGRKSVVFLATSKSGGVIAAQGRALDSIDKMSAGSIGSGVFVTPGTNTCGLFAIAEAPIDALSLYLCGMPAIALFGKGTSAQRERLSVDLAWKTVFVALDSDDPGETASQQWCEVLTASKCRRLQPEGAKDWNEVLLRDGQQKTRWDIATRTQTAGPCIFCDKNTAGYPEHCEPEDRTICQDCWEKRQAAIRT